jgi:hypothetical protein
MPYIHRLRTHDTKSLQMEGRDVLARLPREALPSQIVDGEPSCKFPLPHVTIRPVAAGHWIGSSANARAPCDNTQSGHGRVSDRVESQISRAYTCHTSACNSPSMGRWVRSCIIGSKGVCVLHGSPVPSKVLTLVGQFRMEMGPSLLVGPVWIAWVCQVNRRRLVGRTRLTC